MTTAFDFDTYATSKGLLPLADSAALDAYDDAITAVRNGGSPQALTEALSVLGIPADIVQWHVNNPGEAMVTTAPFSDEDYIAALEG